MFDSIQTETTWNTRTSAEASNTVALEAAISSHSTLEAQLDDETARRYTTLEVRWDETVHSLTIEEVRLDGCLDMAARIMEVLPYDRFELGTIDDVAIRYRILGNDWRLRRVTLHRQSLRRLAADPDRRIKIEYLQRDLLWSTRGRRSFVYPSALRSQIG